MRQAERLQPIDNPLLSDTDKIDRPCEPASKTTPCLVHHMRPAPVSVPALEAHIKKSGDSNTAVLF